MATASVPSRFSRLTRPLSRPYWVVGCLAALYLAAHIPFIPKTPYDIDGVNFALALHDYDLAKHQPHPPGAPLFVGLGRVALATLSSVVASPASPTADRALDTAALALWSAALGALAAFGIYRFAIGLGEPVSRAVNVTVVTLTTPLFWFSGIRPMSDLPGLAVSLLALAALAPWLTPRSSTTEAPLATAWPPHAGLLLGCFVAGLAPGMRIQMAWLVWPAAAVALAVSVQRRERAALAGVGCLVLGTLVWLIPLSLVVGGPAEYLRLVRLQAGDDVSAGQMLALNVTARTLALALNDSLIAPWGQPWLGIVALSAAAAGGVRLLLTQPRRAATLALVFGPYAVLHLGFHETSHIRYALPLVPAVAVMVVQGVGLLGPRLSSLATLGLVTASLAIAFTAAAAQSREAAPVYRALDEVRARLRSAIVPAPVVAMHHSVSLALRGEIIPATTVLPSPLRYEWLALADYWRSGGEAPIWFLANRRRTDLALIDRDSRLAVKSFSFPEQARALSSGTRPRSVDWVEIRRPGWIALEGWSLTPEVRGVTVREYRRNWRPEAKALLRRRPEEVSLLLGGRNLGGPCATGAVVTLFIDHRKIQQFTTSAGESFAHTWRLPAGTLSGNGPYAELHLVTEDRSGAGGLVDVAFEQFDVQGPGHATAALVDGWFEPEFDDADGIAYRWMSDAASVRIDGFGQDVALRLRGDAPVRQFAAPSTVVVRAGSRLLSTHSVEGDFDVDIEIPAAVLAASDGTIRVEASQSFVPDERTGNGDLRVLALRVRDVDVRVRRARESNRRVVGAE
jgi:hypothetical protein